MAGGLGPHRCPRPSIHAPLLPLCHPERGPLLCPWARLQPGAAPGRCRAQDQPPNSCLLLTDCPPTAVSLQRGRVHGRPGQSGGDLRPAWACPNTAALPTSPHLPSPLPCTRSFFCRPHTLASSRHGPPPALAPVRRPETLFKVPLKKPDSVLWDPGRGPPHSRGLAGPRKPGERGAGTLPSLGTLWAQGPPSCPCEVGGRAHASSIQGAGPVHAAPSAWFPDSPGSGPKPEAGLPNSQLPGRRCQAPGRGCTPRWAGPRGRASSVPPATAVSPLCLHHAQDLLPQPHPPNPHPKSAHPPPHCCTELLTPLAPVLRPRLVWGGLGQDQRDRGHLPDPNRAQDLRDSPSTQGGGPLCRAGEPHVLRPPGRTSLAPQVIGQAGWGHCRCADVQAQGMDLCPRPEGPRLGGTPRGLPARPRQLAPGTLCRTPGPRAPLRGALASFLWPKFPITPWPAGPSGMKLRRCKQGLVSPPRVTRLGHRTMVGLVRGVK